MSTSGNQQKILLTTAYIRGPGDYYDYVSTNIPWKIRFRSVTRISTGLRFIKENVPGIEILEYPTWEEYQIKLREGWDIVGFSFYLNETHRVHDMVGEARKQGVKTLWGGNYGVLTPETQEWFDEFFIGYSESQLMEKLGHEPAPLKHPDIIRSVDLPLFGRRSGAGLFTTRGCTVGCTFCQGPCFTKKIEDIPMESIEETLNRYISKGINMVAVLDENFGTNPRRAREIVSMFESKNVYWGCMTRADYLEKQLDEWTESNHLIGTALGIESLNQERLDKMKKKTDADRIINLLGSLKEKKVGILGFYLLGLSDDTEESIRQDVKRLASLKIDVTQLTILTPLPSTPLWDEIETEYGIFEKDYEKFDTKHLVWNHPNISPENMEKVLEWSLKKANPRLRTASTVARVGWKFHKVRKDSKSKNSGRPVVPTS